MELRVWVDGTQRVVCGVKLATTCQEIVFALAHATKQAGRFTMIERWRNNERLLSPNEQPLVTLQRWGDHMNEVEFILRKTSTDLPSNNQPLNGLQAQHATQQSKNFPYEDLYSTINKKHTNQPPAVPAKPRVIGHITPVPTLPTMTHQPMQRAVTNPHLNFYNNHQHHHNTSPLNMYSNTIRPRQPPGYMEYLEAIANRGPTMVQPSLPSSTSYAQQAQHVANNMYHRSFDQLNMYNRQQNGSSPASTSSSTNRYRSSSTNPLSSLATTEFDLNNDTINSSVSSHNTSNPILPKLIDANLVVNRGSAVNIRLPSSSQNLASMSTKDRPASSIPNSNELGGSSSMSQMGHEMLKVIEEQKKVLINQKNELDRLDTDQEYWDSKQNSEQAKLINRIDEEIHQLEDLWKQNQVQITKLENQELDKELQSLKNEQVKMEEEIDRQRTKLSLCVNEISLCKRKLEQLESELANQLSDSEASSSSTGEEQEESQNESASVIAKNSASVLPQYVCLSMQ